MTGDKPDMLLWLDVETTALDPTRGQLLEVGMAVTGNGRGDAERRG